MSYVDKITVVQNDYGYDLEFQLTDASGNPVDLTGATAIKVFIAEPEALKAKVVGDCIVMDATHGLCKYTVREGDFDEGEKRYFAEVEVSYVNKVITAKRVTIYVVSELPESTT
jgi:hypothetical protein